MNLRFLIVPLLAVLLLAALPAAPVRAAPLCFPETGFCIDGRLRSFWEQQGGLRVFGYPLGPAVQQQSANGPITVQLFERNRLEWHPNNPAPYDVQLGRLGAAALERQGSALAPPAPPQDGCRYFAETGRNVCPPFAQAWSSYGLELGAPGLSREESIALFGLPLTPAQPMTLSDGRQYTVQWFERARFEDHGPQGVQFGLLGRELSESGAVLMPAPAARPTPQDTPTQPVIQPGISQEPGGFIRVSGDQLVRFGQSIQIKGVNYYPEGRPWSEMWSYWDAPQMERELRLARERLGINAVRILLPYDVRGDGHVDAELVRLLQEFLQIAGSLDMRVIITMFDFYDGFPEPGSRSEDKNLRYVQRLVGNFAGDERILAWDIHNEPDHYPTWENGDAQRVLMWLGRMADEVKRIAPNHLVTVGMGQYQNLYQPGPDGRRVIDYSDVISWHNYNAADTARQLDEIRRHTDKPILLQEFGWPTGPNCVIPTYDEGHQAAVYSEMLAAATGRVAGIFAWTLRDYHAGPTMRWDTREEHYGLFRHDDTLKPAAQSFAAYPAAPLPSITQTSLELTSVYHRIDGEKSPKQIPETGFYVKDWFRSAWRELGGRGSFGLPISEAYVRPSDGMVVQHFTAATLEYHKNAMFAPDFYALPQEGRTMRMIRPAPIGREYTQGITFPPPPPVTPGPHTVVFPETGYAVSGKFLDFYYNFLGEWRLGNPISPEIVERIGDVDVTVQYFERGRLDFNPLYNVVQVGQIGSALWDRQCRQVAGGQQP
jgi:hypothetical protein